MKQARNTSKALWLFTPLLALSLLPVSLLANDREAPQRPGVTERENRRLELEQLERRYWAPKDADFAVVQNRTYTKSGRLTLSGSYGLLMNDSFTEGSSSSLGLGYYFSERWGLEASYLQNSLSPSDTTDVFAERFGASPDYNMTLNSTTLSLVFVPFYAKMSFMDKSILYFDMAVSLGVGQTNYAMQTNRGNEEASTTHFALDLTQHFFLSENFAFRFDIKNHFMNQEKRRFQIGSLEPESARALPSDNYINTYLLLGITLFY